jgi:hypothetical protein
MNKAKNFYYRPKAPPPSINAPAPNAASSSSSTSTTPSAPPSMHQNACMPAESQITNQSAASAEGSQPIMTHTQPNVVQLSNSSQSVVQLVASTSTTSSSSSTVASNTDDNTLETLLALPDQGLSLETRRAQNLLKAMHKFVANPFKTRTEFIAVCELLKASSNNKMAETLSRNGEVQWLQELSKQTVEFLTCVNSQSDEVIGWTKLSMNHVAQICYALKASLEPNRAKDYFSNEQLVALTPVLRGITRKLIDHVDHKQLMKPTHQSFGDVLSVLAWLIMGLKLSMPTSTSEETKLLAGASKGKVGIDAIFKQALNYFSAAKLKAMDTRQLGKLIYSLGRVLNQNLLNLNEACEGAQTLGQRLSNTILDLCRGNALLKYCEWDVDNFDQQVLKQRSINPVAVENLADGMLAFLSHLFDASDARVGSTVNNMTGLIQKVLQSGKEAPSNLTVYLNFLNKAWTENFEGTDSKHLQQTIKLVKERMMSFGTSS